MHLKSLTLKGFKSFASATTLRFEPGITCVVGPNGSGKSNVIDAIAWVLGEQGAKALRGGQMSDVIFAGTPGRPPLGRAEVTLVIDNTDGALPIDYTEVAISRLMFRSGESEYSINGQQCRLLDVQELMSDSGIGRELHVVVGQGQLDSVLHARPEERRAFIEEAAGVLKHRKRKEKALRKLEAMQANLNRLTDLTAEIRRQLGPLGRQAEVARKAGLIQATLRDAKLRLLADDLLAMRSTHEAEIRDEHALLVRRQAAETALSAARAGEADLETAAATVAPALARVQETYFRLSALRERFRGTTSLAAERARHLGADETGSAGRDPEQLEFEAVAVRSEESELVARLEADRGRVGDAVVRRTDLESQLVFEERAVVTAARAAADRREGLARLAGQVAALRSRVTAGEEEIARLTLALVSARERAATATAEHVSVMASAGVVLDGGLGPKEAYEAAADALAAAQARMEALVGEEREAERQRTQWQARGEALALSLARKDGAGALIGSGVDGVLGSVAGLLTVLPGAEAALAAVLGAVADAVAVDSPRAAIAALTRLKRDDAGRAGMLVGSESTESLTSRPDQNLTKEPPPGARWATDLVEVPAAFQAAVARLLNGVVVVDSLEAAEQVARSGLRAVTLAGDVLGQDWAVGGSASAPSLLEVQAAADEARDRVTEAAGRAERLAVDVAAAREVLARAKTGTEAALATLRDADARTAAVAERLGGLEAAAVAAGGEAERLGVTLAEAQTARDTDLQGLAGLEERLRITEATPLDDERTPAERDRLAAACTEARAEEMEARLAVRTGEERVRALGARAESLERAAVAERVTRERLAAARARRTAGAQVASAIAEVAAAALAAVEAALKVSAAERDEAQSALSAGEGELLAARARVRELSAEVEALRDVVHRDEVARTEQRLRVEALETRATEEWGLTAEDLLGDYGPDVAVPGEPGEDGLPTESVPYDRAAQAKRAATADRQMALLGRVNPLALEEFDALQERHAFLAAQLEDLKNSRRDLLGIVKEVDDRIHDVFKAAFDDTAREFELIFETLFPGGRGRLVLTEPDDLMATGIEVEATPAGKKVKRLSLLSGGERSLAAIALLIAIFKARPSPFYVLDEIEAALDDRNLGRLLEAIESLRASSQLIVVTHQKRTMEIADALYGVSMRGDGVTTVISQRLREAEGVSA